MPTLRAFLPTDRLRTAGGEPVEVYDRETLAVLGCSGEPLMFRFAGEELGPVSISPVSAGSKTILRRPGKRDHAETFSADGLLILVPVHQEARPCACRLARGRKIGLDIDVQALAGCCRNRRGGAVLSAISGRIGAIRLCTDGSPDAVVSIID